MAEVAHLNIPFNVSNFLTSQVQIAADALNYSGFDPAVPISSDSKHGDFQANGALKYGKQVKLPPPKVGAAILAQLQTQSEVTDNFDISVAGPGFVNFTMKPSFLAAWLKQYNSLDTIREGATASSPLHGKHYVVDYSSPNTAKEMHVGHLRSAVIGEALCRILELNGVKVTRDNHIGDWGTQFGKLIYAYKRHLNQAALDSDPIAEFERLYKLGNAACKAADDAPEDVKQAAAAALEEARSELVKLQQGDEGNTKIWKHINDVSMSAFQVIYDLLGIHHDIVLGESFYNDKVDRVYRELQEINLAEDSKGALCVFFKDIPRFASQAFMVRKSDGASNYAATDLATALYRSETMHVDGALYVIDSRQSDHCALLFLTAEKWFAAKGYDLPVMKHTAFGTVFGEGGKPLQTRDGENIKLKALLEEAQSRAFDLVTEKSPELPEEQRREIARIVGIDSVQYADLCQNRVNDYEFSFSKMISLEGNTAAYMLYAIARIYSIFEKIGVKVDDEAFFAKASLISEVAELNLARKLCKFPDVIERATTNLTPHIICTYVYELTQEFSSFYNKAHVNVPEEDIKARRALLCSRTVVVLETSLKTLGLRTLTKM